MQDPDACILAFEPNSNAYIEQFPSLPSPDICTVEECKKNTEKHLRQWYRDTEGAEEKIAKELETIFRYADDKDIVIEFT